MLKVRSTVRTRVYILAARTVLAGVMAVPLASAALAGPLTPPPGPVAPTMKTLQEVEPRTPVSAATTPGNQFAVYAITAPGSYYLASDVAGEAGKNTIGIYAPNVTLDLSGFTVTGHASGVSGILVAATAPEVTIRNGRISGAGDDGLRSFAQFLRIEDVHASQNTGHGFAFTHRSSIHRSTARSNGANGIQTGDLAFVTDCQVLANAGIGIFTRESCTIERNTVNNNTVGGIHASSQSVVRANLVDFHVAADAYGIQVSGQLSRVEDNHVIRGTTGLLIPGVNNVVAGNTVRNNANNFNIAGGNQVSLVLWQIPQTIDFPAHVTLAGSIIGAVDQHGLTIASDDVTIDLGGHTLIGPGAGAARNGIRVVSSVRGLVVRNGSIRNWTGYGIDALFADGARFEDLTLRSNAVGGMHAGANGTIQSCIADSNGGSGFAAGGGATFIDCTSRNHPLWGYSLPSFATLERCSAHFNGSEAGGGGFRIFGYSSIRGCFANGHGGTRPGLLLDGPLNTVDGNSFTNGIVPIRIVGNANLVVRNLIATIGSIENTGTGNQIGPITPAGSATNPWANVTN